MGNCTRSDALGRPNKDNNPDTDDEDKMDLKIKNQAYDEDEESSGSEEEKLDIEENRKNN